MIKPLIPLPQFPDEHDRVLYGDEVLQSVRQLKALLELDPPLPVETIAERMATSKKDTVKLLKILGRQR